MNSFRPHAVTIIAVLSFQFAIYASSQAVEGLANDRAESPHDLLEQGRIAFQKIDFVAAEKYFDRFFANYSENPEAKEAIHAHRPLLALSKVGVGKYEEALVYIESSLKHGKLKVKLEDELSFWRCICLMQSDDHSASQEALGEYWANDKHEPFKRYEALLLFAGLYLHQGFEDIAADFLKEQIPKMRKLAPEAAGRAVVLRMHALMKAEKHAQALQLLRVEYTNIENLTQVVSFQMQALDLGVHFLEDEQYRKAIFCLQRVWSKKDLLRHQNERLDELRNRVIKLSNQGDRQAAKFQIKAVIRRVEREIVQLEKLENFDSALRLRVAIAYQSQERYREAALVMESMLREMSPDSVVDSASVALIQNWMKIERWPKAVESADLYLARFTDWEGSSHLPEAMFLKADALKEMNQTQKAAVAYGDLVEHFPEHVQAPAALFMQAYMYLVQDDSEGAVYHFDLLRSLYPEHELVEDSDYWTGMALSFASEYAQAKGWIEAYLVKYGSQENPAKYQEEAQFRLAYCVFALGDHLKASELFQRFIVENKSNPLIDEARLLLGDTLLAEGEMDKGITSYRRISPESKKFHEDGWFKIGKAFRLMDKLSEMREHFVSFLAQYPDSSRMPEAVYWAGWVDRQNGNIAQAKQVYWETLTIHGNDPDLFAIEDLIAALPKLYRDTGGEGEQQLLIRLEGLQVNSVAKGYRLLALRIAWGIAQVYKQSNKEAYQVALLKLTPEVDARHDDPRITVDCADAQLEMGNYNVAENLYELVRKWHPRAVERDRVFAGLGRIAEHQGEVKKAISYYERFERETASPSRLSEVKLDRARLLRRVARGEEVRLVLNELLENQAGSSRIKAQALFEFAELLMNEGEPRKAAAYYERIYVVYGKYRQLVAQAYWRRGEALEELSLKQEALEVYAELAGRDDLRVFNEAKMAGQKLLDLSSGERGPS